MILVHDIRLIFFAIFIIIFFERAIFTFIKKEKPGNIKHQWITLFIITSYIFCIFLAPLEFFIKGRDFNLKITLFGLFIIISGIILRRFSIRTLKNNWSIHVKDIPEQQIITTGPYKWVRHPYYDAVILELAGVSLYFNSLLALSYLLVIHLPLLIVRVLQEENILSQKFQDQYANYQERTGMFLPRL